MTRAFSAGSVGRFFSERVREKGHAYARRGRVRFFSASNEHVEAEVKGDTGTYSVSAIYPDDSDVIECSCECPYAADQGALCKHIWATLIVAEERGVFGRSLRGSIQDVYLTDGESDYDPDHEDVEDVEVGHYDLGNSSDIARLAGLFRQRQQKTTAPRAIKAPPVPAWKNVVQSMTGIAPVAVPISHGWGVSRDIVYVINAADANQPHLSLQLCLREMKKNGEWGKPRNGTTSRLDIEHLPALDREIVATLKGASGYGYYDLSSFVLSPWHCETLLPRVAATGKLYLRSDGHIAPSPIAWDDGEAWAFEIAAEKGERGKAWRVYGRMIRGEETRLLPEFDVLHSAGLALRDNTLARANYRGAYDWIRLFARNKDLTIPANQFDDFLTVAFAKGTTPPIRLPAEVGVTEIDEPMRPVLKVKKHPRSYPADLLRADLVYRYGETNVPFGDSRSAAFDPEKKTLTKRSRVAEGAALGRLDLLGLKPPTYYEVYHTLTGKRLPEVARALLAEGWLVEAEGKLYRTAGTFDLKVSSGIDWFELRGNVDFDGKTVTLPKILEAVRNRQTMVDLGDGDVGILPEEWLKKYALLAGAGDKQKDHLRFGNNQVGLLDALLLAQPDVDIDAKYREARERFRSFKGIAASEPPPSFVGELRPYQAEGLGWLKFLRDFGFGGCLADDMGLGKTVQVLALLADRVVTRPATERRPSLVVMPKSLVFNWKAEAAKFAPQLTVLDYTGTDRKKDPAAFDDFDLVLTTYGTVRMDAALLKDVTFDYGILDESQAIKNAGSESAKACRLLNVRHRLAMSGTPIENHLGELGSLFDYLNPGMLGRATAFQLIGGTGRGADDEARTILAHAIRPYLLRRTKDQVAKDLPQKTEQTVFCELEPKQRKVYDDLKEYYRKSILGAVETVGLAKAKIQILEALLRLRQAACHPGLLDKKKAGDPSTKLDALLPQLTEVFEEGHKALVFSQFTSFLELVKQRLDADGIPYEYLDGKTPIKQRQAKVETFQNDPTCKLFLISLKAGGVGLNLTAAEYVFLLDPWWNPAVEAQAVDRAHRIGQTKPVFAYRYIAKDTVEEKVLALQQSKKALADSIINADNSLIRTLKREDLELLLS